MTEFQTQRPSEKVRAYLRQREREGQLAPGSRLPPTEELAAYLNVSPGTVKNVYRALAKDGQVRTQVGQGSFWIGEMTGPVGPLRIGISVNADLPQENRHYPQGAWIGRVFGGILQGKLGIGREIAFDSLPPLDWLAPAERTERLGCMDGVISLTLGPVPEPLCDATGRRVPLVTLNPLGELGTANFVSPDYYESSYRVGEVWRELGRARVLMLTHAALSQSASTRLRFSGLVGGLGERIGDPVELRCFNAGKVDQVANISRFLDQGWTPDAVYTTGGGMIFELMEALAAHKIDVPGQCSVISGSGYNLPNIDGHLPVTTMSHPLEEVGRSLLAMLLRRIASGGAPEPGRYLGVPFHIGGSTLPAENALFTRYSRQVLAEREQTIL